MPTYIDLTVTVNGLMQQHEKDMPEYTYRKTKTHERDGRQGGRIEMANHAGTHIDAPRHFIKEGISIDEIPIDQLIGEAALIDVSHKLGEAITAKDLMEKGTHVREGDIILIRTGWMDKLYGTEDCFNKASYLTKDAAEWLVKKKAKMVGFDTPTEYLVRVSVQKHRSGQNYSRLEDWPVHHTLLSNGIPKIEYIGDLTKVKKKRLTIIALPLKLKDLDGSPARIIAIEE